MCPLELRKEMKHLVLSHEGDKWSVKFDVRDLDEAFGYCLSKLVFDVSC